MDYTENESDQEFLIDPKNYADDEELAKKAIEFISKVSTELQRYRSGLNEKYLAYYRIYRAIFDVRYYNGEAQVYIPVLRKAVEQFVSRVKRALFPTDDVFEVEPIDADMDDESDVIYDYMKWTTEKRVKLKSKIDRFLRQLAMFGWAVVECGWEEDIKKIIGLTKKQVPVMETITDPLSGEKYKQPTGEVQTVISEGFKEIVKKKNPTFEVQDNFATYLWPHTANDMDEVLGILTLSKQTKGHLLKQQSKGFYTNIDSLGEGREEFDDEWHWTMEERLVSDELTDANNLKGVFPRFTVKKYHGIFNWGTDEEPEEEETVITTIGNICVELRKCQYYDNEKPYLIGRMNDLINEIYSIGLIEPSASLQYYLNDTANQTFDSNYYTLNPIVKYDPGRVVNIASIAFAPGAMWALTDPTAADIIRPPEVASIGFNIMAQIKAIIEEQPGLQNIPVTGRKAALHIQALQSEFSLPVQQLVENLEDTVMSPWLGKAYSRCQQFLNKKDVIRVTGKKGAKYWRTISPENLVGDYNFYWRGANQSVNLHVKSQQIAQFLNTAAPWIQFMIQQGKKIPDIGWILSKYWSDGLGMDGEDKALVNVQDDRALPPEIENIILSLGKPIPTSMGDNHEEHIPGHQPLLQSEMPEVRQLAQQHIEKHQKDLAALQKLMSQRMPAQQPEEEGEVEGEREMEGNQQVPNLGGRI